MLPFLPIPFLVIAVALTIRGDLRKEPKQIYIFKPLATMLVMLICLLSLTRPNADPGYTWAILLGLFFSLGGDVALMFISSKAFLAGVACFLLAQVVYGVTFATRGALAGSWLGTAIVMLLLFAALMAYLYPHLGKMRLPVLVYAAVISFMVLAAVGTRRSPRFGATQSWLVAVGAILFYISDVILAVNKFAHPFKYARLANLSAYYAGQLLIALSASYALGA